MKKRYLVTMLALSLGAVGLLGGCNSKEKETDTTTQEPVTEAPRTQHTFDASETSIFVRRDGSISSLETDDSFDKDYYDVDEFRCESVEPVISDYNKAVKEETAVSLKDVSLSEGTLSLNIDYASAKHYLDFNKSFNEYFEGWDTFVVCTVGEAQKNGIDITGAFVDGKGEAVSSTKIKEEYKDYYICAVKFGASIPNGVSGSFYFEGDIAFTSNGVSVTADNAVRLYEGDDVQYILFY